MSALDEAQEQRYAAMSAGDADALAALLDDRLVYTHSRGDRDTRASYLEKIHTDALAYGPITHRENPPLLTGRTAIVVGEMETDVRVRGATRRMHNAFLAVWTEHDGRWLLTAYQPTPVP
jgi:ketosteroid isomerase-like protein